MYYKKYKDTKGIVKQNLKVKEKHTNSICKVNINKKSILREVKDYMLLRCVQQNSTTI